MKKNITISILLLNCYFLLSTFWLYIYKTPLIPLGFVVVLILLLSKKEKRILYYLFSFLGVISGVIIFGFYIAFQDPLIKFGFRTGKIISEGDKALEKIEKINDLAIEKQILLNAYENDKNNYELLNRIGWYFIIDENFIRAKDFFYQALELKQKSEKIKNNIRIVEYLIENNAYAFMKAGASLLQMEKKQYTENGIKFMEKSLKLLKIKDKDTIAAIYYDLGVSYKKIGLYKKAQLYLKMLLDISPNDIEALNQLKEIESGLNIK